MLTKLKCVCRQPPAEGKERAIEWDEIIELGIELDMLAIPVSWDHGQDKKQCYHDIARILEFNPVLCSVVVVIPPVIGNQPRSLLWDFPPSSRRASDGSDACSQPGDHGGDGDADADASAGADADGNY